jgi:hypothetical protein
MNWVAIMGTQKLTALDLHASLIVSLWGQYTETKMADQSSEQLPTSELLRMTADVVAAYVGNNPLATNELPGIISTVHTSLTDVSRNDGAAGVPLKPAVPIRKSVTPDFIVCLEDGKKLKMHRLPRGRQEAEDAQAPPAHQLQPDAR